MQLTVKQKRTIGKFLQARYYDAHNVRFDRDGAVHVSVGTMPNTNSPGRIFAGWADDLLRQATSA